MRAIRFVMSVCIAVGGLSAFSMSCAHEGHDHAAGMRRAANAQAHQNDNHENATEARRSRYARSQRAYQVPDVTLINADMRRVRLHDVLAADNPVMIDFVSTRCVAACPEISQAFSMVQNRLGSQGKNLRLISFFVDPQRDTPAEVKLYAMRYGAQANWQLLSGGADDIEMVRRAFDVDRDDKASVRPVALLRPARGKPWLRIEGSASADDLAAEYRELMRN